MSHSVFDSVSSLKGVGDVRLKALAKAGIHTLGDLLMRFPSKYRSGKVYPLSQDRVGEFSCFSLTAATNPAVYTLPGGRRALRFTAVDEANTRVQVIYWNQPYLRRKIAKGDHAFYFGTLHEKSGVFYLFSPEREEKASDPEKLRPIYSVGAGISTKTVEKWMEEILVPCLSQIEETLPPVVLDRYRLLSRKKAVFLLHAPTNEASVEEAKRRFGFENLFTFSVKATLFSEETKKSRVPGFSEGDVTKWIESLPFSLTGAQKRVIDEIRSDLVSNGLIPPMNRLIQGDVGSGKTAVAAAACYLAAQNNKASLVMAPTEILAQQHHRSFSKLLQNTSIPVLLLTGSTTKKERDAIFEITSQNVPYLLIGTHALVEESAKCQNVGLTVTDEQHRFGVRHRTLLGEKGGAVHSLVMSATPIPRSLAMFLHARRNISIIDELPPGRTPIDTFYVGEDKLQRVYGFLEEKIALGQQAYVVCPLIEDEEDKSLLQSAEEEFRAIKKALPHIPVALLHGKMKSDEKQRVMESFQSGEVKILVSTTVIEVGVDVPSASVMVIRNAERFGLSQLHQLRGRVGRGKEKSYCILISSHSGKNARERLKKLCDCRDGFELAKYDLETRGPGEFFGTQQSGFGALTASDLSMEMLKDASDAARLFLETATDDEIRPYENKIGLN